MTQPDREKSGIQPRKEVPVNDRIVKTLLFISIAVQFVGAQFNPQDLGGTISEALYMAKELPAVNKPDYFAPNGIAVSKDHKTLYITAEAARQILFVDLATSSITRHIDLPASPTGLVVSPDGSEIYVTCMSELLPVGVVAVVPAGGTKIARTFEAGHSPRSPVISPDGTDLYVCNRLENKVRAYDIAGGAVQWEADSKREPYAATLTPDGTRLLVANYLPSGRNDVGTLAAKVLILDAKNGELLHRIQLFNGTQSCADIEVSADGRYAYIPHVRSLHAMTPHNKIEMGWINSNAVGIIDLSGPSLIGDLMLDNPGAGAANPWDMVVTGSRAYVAFAGSRELHTLNLQKLHAAADTTENFFEYGNGDLTITIKFGSRSSVPVMGGRHMACVGDTVFVVGRFSDNIAVLDTKDDAARFIRKISLHGMYEHTPQAEQKGEFYFNNAKEMCFQNWHSCASCHPGGRINGTKWDLENDGEGNFKDTKSLLAAHLTPPSTWTGVRDSLEIMTRSQIQYVLFWDPAHLETQAQAIDTYIGSLRPFPSPALTLNGLNAAAVRGKDVFNQLSCGTCHPDSNYFTDQQIHEGYKEQWEVGPFDGKWDTPTLHEVWRTAPYMHNGGCATLKDVFQPPYTHGLDGKTITDQQLNDLVEYLKTL